MKNVYLLILSGLSSYGYSQTILTKAANDYVAGNSINSKNLVGTPDNSAVGASVTFNNSALTNGSFVVAQVSAPSATELTNFPGTTVKFNDGNGNQIFYKSSATQLEITAAGISGAVLNFSNDNAVFLKFPTAFGDTYTDTARGSFSNGTISGLFRGTITTSADATGTLLLGSETFTNILRVKTVQTYNLYQTADTNYLFSIGTLVSTFYTYYNNTNRYPLFTATTATIAVPLLSINQTTSASVAQDITTLSAQNFSSMKRLQAYPNPFSDHLFFDGDLKGYESVKIFSMDGKLVKTDSLSGVKIDTSDLFTGNYILQLSGKNKKDESFQIFKK